MVMSSCHDNATKPLLLRTNSVGDYVGMVCGSHTVLYERLRS